MQPKAHRMSVFSQSLDAAAFTAYLLGAVVPLLALALVAHRYAIPSIGDWRDAWALLAGIVSIGMLSLAAYFLLRKLTRDSLARAAADNTKLQMILETAEALATARHRSDAANTVATCALELSGSEVVFVLSESKAGNGDEPAVLAAVGRQGKAEWSDHRDVLAEPVRLAIEFGRTILRESRDENANVASRVQCLPICVHGGASSALAVLGGHEGADSSLATLAALAAVALRSSELQDVQRNFFVQMTDLLLATLDQHQDYHQGHSRRVAHISSRIGRELDFDDVRMERLYFAALLHDIGMLKIPRDKHANEKVERKHPAMGHRMLSAIRVWEDIAPFVLYHHEWFNGEGYPEGLAGENIPLEARVIGLAEAVDSMVSRTSYKDAMPAQDMLKQVRDGAGTQFDPEVARVFLSLVERGAIELEGS